jgi:hypothetical protein
MPTYKALSIRQPYANWICNPDIFRKAGLPVKNIENRDWPTSYRGTILIHASKTFEENALGYWSNFFPQLENIMPTDKDQYTLGAIAGYQRGEQSINNRLKYAFLREENAHLKLACKNLKDCLHKANIAEPDLYSYEEAV